MNKYKVLVDISLHDPVIYNYLYLYAVGSLTYEQALEEIAIMLSSDNHSLRTRLVYSMMKECPNIGALPETPQNSSDNSPHTPDK